MTRPASSLHDAERPSLSIAAIAAFLAVGLLGCGGEPPPEPVPIVLVSIDTLRSDRLPAYGYDGVDTPAIDRLAADGIVYERAYAHAPVTLPSHVSLFSGTLPSRHGVRDNPGYRVPRDLAWLPELLRRHGYATGGSVSAAVLAAETGMDRGFDFYDDGSQATPSDVEPDESQTPSESYRPGGVTVERALTWLDRVDQPLWFLFVHLYEPHRPYDPPEPFASRYASAYDGEIAAADAAVGSLLEGLEARGLYDGSLVVLTSDHGEGLGEHGERDHGVFVYRESLQVPLIVKLPRSRRAGRRVERPVQLVDVVPTILRRIGAPLDADSTGPGTSLLADDAGDRLIYAESYLPRLYYGASELHTLIGKRLQYIDSPNPELYDLVADPAGTENLIDQDPEIVDLYRQRIAQLTSELEPPQPIDPATRERLAALGYLGGATPATGDDLPAPQDQLDVLQLVQQAYDDLSANRLTAARRGFSEAVERNPRAAFAWAQLARTERLLGNDEAALDAMLMAIRLADHAPFRLLPTARLALRLGRTEEAEELAREALDWRPAEAKGVLARLRLRDGRVDEAHALVLEALDADPGWTAPALNLLSIYLRMDRAQEALRLADEIDDRITETPIGFNLLVGDALVRLGRPQEAIDWVEKEIALFPERPRAYGYLATLYGSLDRAEEAGLAIDRLLANVPGPEKYLTAVRTLIQLGFPREGLDLLDRGREEFPDSAELEEMQTILSRAQR
ncbi:MAG: sulfatase-like hydrolase/transferase [Thermoanaerobaculia bacterium]|nr:sulfatase-like hydrolase/transferase [Thermoanaerobaculia bacterium]